MGSPPSSSGEVWAKRDETLRDHVNECLRRLKAFLETLPANALQDLPIGRDELESRLFATVYLHDIGKASKDFQERIRAVREGRGPPARGLPHALLSIPFGLACAPPIDEVPHEALAIGSHHTPYYDGLYSDWDAADADRVRQAYLWDEAITFYRELPKTHERWLDRAYPFPLRDPPLDSPLYSVAKLRAVLRDALLNYPKHDVRRTHATFLSTLLLCDWLASGHRDLPSLAPHHVSEGIGALFHRRGASLRDYQEEAAQTSGHILIRLPTGKGKTETALLWAEVNSSSGRIIYLLPSRVASNALYDRFRKSTTEGGLGLGNRVGLCHGMSAFQYAKEFGCDSEEYRSQRLLASTWITPLTVATLDQLLLAKLNWSHWQMVEGLGAGSAFILDEIHAYQPYTLALAILACREFIKRGARVAVMSATFPNFLERAFSECLGNPKLVSWPSFDEECRHRLIWRDEELLAAVDEVAKRVREGCKVLVIANTVGGATGFYEQLRTRVGPRRSLLYHSRFIEEHRRLREMCISAATEGRPGEGFALVATQVVEVSLDVDFDELFTEAAPLDALVQRLGRVNRKGLKGVVNVQVFNGSPGSIRIYGKERMEKATALIEEVSRRDLREGLVRDLIERQYPADEAYATLLEEIGKAERRVREIRKALWQVQTLQLSDDAKFLRRLASSRPEEMPSVDAIPLCYKEEVEQVPCGVLAAQFIVRVPLHIAQDRLIFKDGRLYVNLPYDEEFGLRGEQADAGD